MRPDAFSGRVPTFSEVREAALAWWPGQLARTALSPDYNMFALFRKAKDESKLRDRIDDLEKALRRLEEEWTEVYHKFRVLQMRVAKQVQRLDEAPETETTTPPGGETPREGPTDSQGAFLTPGAAKWQERILARRNRAREV